MFDSYFIQEAVRTNLNVILCETSDNLEMNVTEPYKTLEHL